MSCPFLEQVTMRYCKAYPIRKMIPASSSQLLDPCVSHHETCPIYQEATGTEETQRSSEESLEVGLEGTTQPQEGEKYCVWLTQDIVSYRLCTRNYDCDHCEFAQMIHDRNGKYSESPDVIREIERLRNLPASQRRCKYMVTGKVLYHPCNMNYECWKCPTYQRIRDSVESVCIEEMKG